MEEAELSTIDNMAAWAHPVFQEVIDSAKEQGRIPEDAHVMKIVVEAGEPITITYK